MPGWLHFIDRSDYFVGKFMKEAQKIGIALTVSLKTLREMEWSDRIALLQMGGAAKVKSAVMFAEFPLERITGLSAKAVASLVEQYSMRIYDIGGDRIIRGQTALDTGVAYYIDARLGPIANALWEMNIIFDIGVPMIACMPDQVESIQKPLPMFPELSYRTGYRRFDMEGVTARIARQRNFNKKRRPKLGGQWEPAHSDSEDRVLKEFAGGIESAKIIDLTPYLEV